MTIAGDGLYAPDALMLPSLSLLHTELFLTILISYAILFYVPTGLVNPYFELDQRGKVMAEYIWIDGDGKFLNLIPHTLAILATLPISRQSTLASTESAC